MSLMYSKKSIGPRTEPCGTPDVTSVMSDRAPLTETRCLRFDRKDVIQLFVLPVIPYEVNLDRMNAKSNSRSCRRVVSVFTDSSTDHWRKRKLRRPYSVSGLIATALL